MANTRIQVKRTSTSGRVANTSDAANSTYIAAGELALNMTDGILYSSNGTTLITIGANLVNQNVSNTLTIKAISANGTLGTSGQQLYSNGAGAYWASPTYGSVNYVQNTAPSITTGTVSSPTVLAQISITTNGNPVQVIASGDANPLSAGGWGVIQLYRGTTAIGGAVNFEASSANENNPYCLQAIDNPGAAGTYTYSIKANSTTGSTQFGESSGPVISVVELQNVRGDANVNQSYVWTNTHTFQNTVTFQASVTHSNNTRVIFSPLAGGSNVYFTQQVDDNFVFYSTDNTNSPRAIWAVYANSATAPFNVPVPVTMGAAANISGNFGVAGATTINNTLNVNGLLTQNGVSTRVVDYASGTTLTLNCDTTDLANSFNTAVAGTLTLNPVSGTARDGQKLMLRLRCTNAQTLSWNTTVTGAFAGSVDLTLPTATTGSSKYDYFGFVYSTTAARWHLIAKNFGF